MRTGTGNRPKRDKKTPKQSKPLKRKIHLGLSVEDAAWTYDINRNGVRIRSPNGEKTYVISHNKFVGWEPDRDSKAEILPSDIVGYIRRECLKTDPDWKYQCYHRNLRFAEEHGINLLETTSRELNKMIEAHEVQIRKEKEARDRKQTQLAMENIDLLLELSDHQMSSCSDEKPMDRGMIHPHISQGHLRRVECTRCYLLHCKKKGKWDPNFKLHYLVYRKPKDDEV